MKNELNIGTVQYDARKGCGAHARRLSILSITARLLPGVALLALGGVMLLAPPTAKAQQQIPNATYINDPIGPEVLFINSPQIYPRSGVSSQYVGFYAKLYKYVDNKWTPVQSGPAWQEGIAYANQPWSGQRLWFTFERYGAGFYIASVQIYEYTTSGWAARPEAVVEYYDWFSKHHASYGEMPIVGWNFSFTDGGPTNEALYRNVRYIWVNAQ
jgi:hypothetical protein